MDVGNPPQRNNRRIVESRVFFGVRSQDNNLSVFFGVRPQRKHGFQQFAYCCAVGDSPQPQANRTKGDESRTENSTQDCLLVK
jgi:hypothetical protein